MAPEEILKHLTPEQRREFEEMLADPTRAAILLESHLDKGTYWWLDEHDIEDQAEARAHNVPVAPAPLDRERLPKPLSSALALGYNLIAILSVGSAIPFLNKAES